VVRKPRLRVGVVQNFSWGTVILAKFFCVIVSGTAAANLSWRMEFALLFRKNRIPKISTLSTQSAMNSHGFLSSSSHEHRKLAHRDAGGGAVHSINNGHSKPKAL
jgi:hypothetical protein